MLFKQSSMDRGAWWATVQRVAKRARNDLLTKQQLKKENIYMKMYEFHSFIHSFNTYSSGREPYPWFIVRHQGRGTTDSLHQYQTFQNQLFSDEQIIFPSFYSFFPDTSTFPGKTWFTEGSTHYLNPWEKQVSLPDTKTGSNECAVITHCSTFHISFSSRNIK